MKNRQIGNAQTYGSYCTERRTRRAERTILASNLAIAAAFLFVTAVVFGLL